MNLLILAAVLFAYMSIAFLVSLYKKDNGVADIAYGWGFVLLAWTSVLLSEPSVVGILLSVLATVWAARLSIRIYLRNHGKPEDFRYRKWREEWGKTFVWRSFLQVYMLQGAVIFVVALPVMLANLYGAVPAQVLTMPPALLVIGLLAWLIGMYFEAVGDYQLARFMGNPENKGKLMDRGLWRYTRHPNYFGESLMWWGIALMAASVAPSAALAVLGFLSPALITFLLLKVSGVPMLEERMKENPGWEEYARKTSVFIPLPPKR